MEINETTTMNAWKAALKSIVDHGTVFVDHDKRQCKEVLNLLLQINNPWEDFEKPVDLISANEKWVYPPKEELKRVLMSKKHLPIYEYTYGSRMFNFSQEFDQLNKFIIPLLIQDPSSRRASIVLYDPVLDSKIYKKEIPSLIHLHFRIIDEKLNLSASIRSNDFFIGWPTNIYQLCVLLQFVAEKLGVEPGSISTISNSAHIFEEYLEDIKEVLS